MNTSPPLPLPARSRLTATLNLILIGLTLLAFQIPLMFVNGLRHERLANRQAAVERVPELAPRIEQAVEGYRMVERAVKHNLLILALVYAVFFLYETLAGLRLHLIHYGLVGAAMSLFYLALLALGEVLPPGVAYAGAALASSLMITLYASAVLQGAGRAAVIGGLLAAVHVTLYIILRMEDLALLAGTAALFIALSAIMYVTRNVDWHRGSASP
jgi:inner membrane protein